MEVLLRVTMNGGQFLNALMPEEVAREYVRRWHEAPNNPGVFGDPAGQDMAWSVRISQIAFIHTQRLPPDQLAQYRAMQAGVDLGQPTQPANPGHSLPRGASGWQQPVLLQRGR